MDRVQSKSTQVKDSVTHPKHLDGGSNVGTDHICLKNRAVGMVCMTIDLCHLISYNKKI